MENKTMKEMTALLNNRLMSHMIYDISELITEIIKEIKENKLPIIANYVVI